MQNYCLLLNTIIKAVSANSALMYSGGGAQARSLTVSAFLLIKAVLTFLQEINSRKGRRVKKEINILSKLFTFTGKKQAIEHLP